MTPDERQARLARLPKWAREELALLTMRLAEARAVATWATAGKADGYLDCYGDFPVPAVPVGDRVRFPLDELGGHRWIDVRRDGGGLEIMASSGLAVRPSASNVALLEVVDW